MFRSDEENCQLVVPSLDYNKDKVPQPLSGESRLQLNSSLIITNILYINELEGYFKATINYKKMWYDRSLTFQNLKQDQTNYLTLKDGIWTPYVMVLNMEAKEDCKEADIKTLFEVLYNENSTHTESKSSEHLNTFLYKGSESPINHESYWTCKYVCQFDYHWYPFDTQICKIKLNVSEPEIELKADFTRYTGMYLLACKKPFHFHISQDPLTFFSILSCLWITVTGTRRGILASLLTSPLSGRRQAMLSPSSCPQGCWSSSVTSPSALQTPSWTWWWMSTPPSSSSSQHSKINLFKLVIDMYHVSNMFQFHGNINFVTIYWIY